MEFTPVDECARFITKLLDAYHYNINIYHLFNNNYLDIHDFTDTLQELNIPIRFITLKQFQHALETNSQNNYFGITNYIENISNHVVLDNTYTNHVLKELSLSWPSITKDYIIKIIEYLKFNKLIGDENEEK